MENTVPLHRECTEIKIKVPWGHIAGKQWGPKSGRPILVLHGWQDNAGTFDPLIPLLPIEFSFLAIDLPGHGFSSYLPDGMTYHNIDYINVILKIMKEMKWKRVSLMGHSMGGMISFWFAGMYPDKVDLLIAIDTRKPSQHPKGRFWLETGKRILGSMLMDEQNQKENEPPCYTYSECVERVAIGFDSVNRDKCHYVLNRNLKESTTNPGKFYFLRDGRLKFMDLGEWPQYLYMELARSIRIPHLFINALDSPYNEPEENVVETISALKKNPLFVYVELPGRHHVHLNDPENVSKIISKFLMNTLDGSCKISKL